MADRTVSVSLIAKVQGYVAGIGTAVKATRQFGNEIDGLGKKSPKQFNDIAQAAAGLGLPLVALAGYAIKAATEFDKQMSHVSAVSNATAGQLDSLRQAALDAGKATAFSATQAAQAEEELAKAGISTADILGGGLTGALSLASAGTLDLREAADIAAKAMNTFQLSGEAVPHVADVLSAAANKSATDVHELGEALKMGGLAARNSGLSLEETTGVLAAFADRALVGSDAGTSLKTMLQFLANPTEKSSKLMQKLGIDVYDAQGNFVGLAKVAGTLQEKLGTLTQEERNQALATIFGADATRAATVLYELGTKGVEEYTSAVNDSGAAQRTAAEKTNNLAGDIERLRGSIETLAIQSGSGANGGLRILVQTIDHLVGSFSSLPGPVQTAGVVIAGAGGAALLAAAGWLKMRQTVREALDALAQAGPAGERASRGLDKTMGVLGKAGAIAGGVFLAYEGVKLLGDWISSFSAPVARDVDKMTVSLQKFADSGEATGEMAKAFGADLQGLSRDIKAVNDANARLADAKAHPIFNTGRGGGQAAVQAGAVRLGDSAKQAKENLAAFDQALANIVTSGNASAAKLVLQQLAEQYGLSNTELAELIAQMPKYNEAAGAAAVANSSLAKGFGDTATNARTMTQTWKDAIDAGLTLEDLFNQLHGAALGFSDAEIAAEAAVDNLKEALDASNGSLDVHNEKGRAAKEAMNGLIRAAIEAAQKKYEETGSLEEANRVYQLYIGQLRATMIAAGMAADKVDQLLGKFADMPKSVTTNVNVITNYRSTGTPQRGFSRYPNEAYGGTVDFYAQGGFHEPEHRAQIMAAGTMRLSGEPETGGEGYIPLGMGKRNQAVATLRAINRRFGNPLGGGGGPRELVLHATFMDPQTGNTTRKQVIRWALDRGRDPSTAFSR